MIDEDALAAALGPGFQVDKLQVWHEMRTDDVETLLADPFQIGRVFLGRELIRHFG